MAKTENVGTQSEFPIYSEIDSTPEVNSRLLEKGEAILAVSEPWRRVVPRWFCEEVCDFLGLNTSKTKPAEEDITHFRLFITLLMSVKHDDSEQHIAIPFARIAECAGMSSDLRNRNYLRGENSTGKILGRFLDETLQGVEALEPDYVDGRARELVGVLEALPDELLQMRIEALKPDADEDRVYFDYPIKSVNPTSRSRVKKKDEAKQEEWIRRALCIPQRHLLEYLHEVGKGDRSSKFRPKDEDLEHALRLATGTSKSIDARISALDQLSAIDRDPVPRYKPSYLGNTVRVFTSGYSYCNINKKLRQALQPDWIELDLASAQLAIVAHDWRVTEIEEFLRAGESIWKSLYDFMEWEDECSVPMEVAKPSLKKGLYAAIFGAGKSTIRKEMYSTFVEGAFEVGIVASQRFMDRIFSHPLVKQLLRERENQIAEIEDNGKATDTFGREIRLSSDTDARSVLAQLAQAKELELLLPALDVAKSELHRADEAEESPRFWIVLWQHDGFSVHVRDQSRRDTYVKRFQEAVNSAVGDYHTRLEVDYPEGEFDD
ncbi:hypothetical protein GGQ19_001750 [Salinibacter ruber]|uniref:hypothetical protein n=1 Tax=Salinibacter ruber TaxID=146919 RepID=UPI002167563B|nr:hypothetical protein [Salinibacter ruber]MCS3750581.1 hypothetical protein [Salinibacter ruber]